MTVAENLKPFLNADLKLLNDYIDSYLVDTLDYDLALDELNKLALFIEDNLFQIDNSTLYDIVMDNRILNSLLETIVKNIIDYDNLEFTSEIVVSLIRAYLMQNNLIEVDEEEFSNHIDSDYYPLNKDNTLERIKLSKKELNNYIAMIPYDRDTALNYLIRAYCYLFEKYIPEEGYNYRDLYQECCVAMLKGVNTFFNSKANFGRYIRSYIANHIKFNDSTKVERFENIDDLNEEDYPYVLTSLGDESFEDKIINTPYFIIAEVLDHTYITNKNKEMVMMYYSQEEFLANARKKLNISNQAILCSLNMGLESLCSSKEIIDLIDYLDDPDAAIEVIRKNISLKKLIISSLLSNYEDVIHKAHLTNLEAAILNYHYGLNGKIKADLADIANFYGLSFNQVAAKNRNALNKILRANLVPYTDLVPNLKLEISKLGGRYKK